MFKIAEDVDLPADAVTQTFALLARRGAGKTYAAGKLAETLLDGGAQVVVVDPVGVWWGLRLGADGVSPGILIPVFGGLHGDIPLEPTAGAVVARLCAEQRTSVVLDVSMFSIAEQRRFVTDFARELFQLKKENRSPIHVMFDEAQEFFPQNVQADMAAMVGAVLKLWKIGRNFGIGGTLISQRPQEVNKSALNLTECLITGQLTGPQERKTIAGWVTDQGMDRGALDELPRLPVGTVYLWSPQWLRTLVKTRFLPKRTFDASKTPEAGDHAEVWENLRPIDLKQVQKAMALTVEHVKANDPKALRAEIANLERRLRLNLPDPDLVKSLTAERDKYRERCGSLAERAAAATSRANELTQRFDEIHRLTELHRLRDRGSISNDEPEPMVLPPAGVSVIGAPPSTSRYHWEDSGRLSGPGSVAPKHAFKVKVLPARAPRDGSVRMLIALAEMHPTPLTYRQLGTLGVMKVTGGSFPTYLSRLATQGYITKENGLVHLTEAGRRAAGDVQKPATARELLAMWREKLPGKAADMLEWLAAERVPKTRSELADFAKLEIRGGTFPTYLSKLMSNGLVARAQGNRLRAVEELWFR